MMSQMTINSQTYKGSFAELLETTAEFGGQVNVWTPKGAVVLIAEEDLRGMLATLEIEAKPKYKAELTAVMAEPLSECVPWEEAARGL